MDKFKSALLKENENTVSMSARLIEPYLKGLKTRIDAVRPLYDVLDNFVSIINEFLSGKSLNYRLSQGFFIKDENGELLESNQLSSGEQQLLLIFAHVLAAREHPSVFIIDEPEISLNIKWQRKIVRSLLSVAQQSEIQFIFASHSLELISQHADAVVEIGRQ
jgi:ABC-type dipeptide/oligopeptide/nickel transport system ATPase subunit